MAPVHPSGTGLFSGRRPYPFRPKVSSVMAVIPGAPADDRSAQSIRCSATCWSTTPPFWSWVPRACGKTTTGRRHCQERLRLDRPAEAVVVRADPDAALAEGPFPLLVDEWQVVPEVLGAVKRAVDEGAAAGSFVLTGSSQADLTAAGWPATGRLIRGSGRRADDTGRTGMALACLVTMNLMPGPTVEATATKSLCVCGKRAPLPRTGPGYGSGGISPLAYRQPSAGATWVRMLSMTWVL
jgi:AAA domain